jgi:DNA-directed RNA polymerase specialized sigma24 family protein
MQSDWVIWREKIHMQGKGRSEFLFSGSLDYKLTDNDENLTLGHTISVEEDLETEVDYEQKLQRIIDFMNPYERQLIYDYVIKEKSGSQLSREQKTPKSTINSRIHKLIEKLRRYINENNLR